MTFIDSIGSLGGEEVTLKRTAPGDYDEATGRHNEGDVTSSTIIALIQPITGKEQEQLSEGTGSNAKFKMFTPYEVRTADAEGGHPADLVCYCGEEYQVQAVEPWGTYFKAILSEVSR